MARSVIGRLYSEGAPISTRPQPSADRDAVGGGPPAVGISAVSTVKRMTTPPVVPAGRSKASCVLLGAIAIGGISIAEETMKRLLESRSKITVADLPLALIAVFRRTVFGGMELTCTKTLLRSLPQPAAVMLANESATRPQ